MTMFERKVRNLLQGKEIFRQKVMEALALILGAHP